MNEYLTHLRAIDGDVRDTVPHDGVVGKKYQALCGVYCYDSIVALVTTPDRPVSCPRCAKLDPHPQFNVPVPQRRWPATVAGGRS